MLARQLARAAPQAAGRRGMAAIAARLADNAGAFPLKDAIHYTDNNARWTLEVQQSAWPFCPARLALAFPPLQTRRRARASGRGAARSPGRGFPAAAVACGRRRA